MNNPIQLNRDLISCHCRSGLATRIFQGALAALASIATLLPPAAACAAEGITDPEAGSPVIFFTLFLLGSVGISVLLIYGLTRWGHKQDQIRSMMSFSIKYMIESKNESEKIEAARALGDAQDPSALLILVDIISDESSGDGLRTAASKSLQEMRQHYHQYADVINGCLKAVEEKDHRRLTELLIENFEQQKQRYAQSAFVIGREYMRIKQYIDAHIWLQYARTRSKKARVYFSQISQLIATCNQLLFSEGDKLFKVGEYHDALERYALASHNLALEEKRRHSAHDRLASVYCKLKHYEDAYQETLLALQDQHKTDTSIKLNRLLQGIRSETADTEEAQVTRDRLESEIDNLVELTMAELT